MMKNKEFNQELIEFIKKCTCSYTTVEKIKNTLKKLGYKRLYEQNNWKLNDNKYYIIRNDASIIAFEIPDKKPDSFSIVTTHCDTPSLLLKPHGHYIKENYLKYNVMPYGGLLNYGWLDHPLSIAGRVIVKQNETFKSKIIDYRKPLFIVPSVPIHQNDSANTNLDLNMQVDLQPISALTKNKDVWNKILKSKINEEIVGYDLFAYNPIEPVLIGEMNELLVSPRIDNITSVYSGLKAFINSKSENIKVFCSFNNEEIGSLTEEGADSNFLLDILKRMASSLEVEIAPALANSFIISSDNTHAIHPNHTEYADDTGFLYLGEGLAIVKETSSSTNAITSSIIKDICQKNKIKFQDSTAKNDLTGGSTLSGISLRHVSVLSIDVGIAQLAMHSSIETCAISDVFELYKLMYHFYQTNIIFNKESYLLKGNK